ncbi:MAG: hypothetical protein WA139_03220 [Candidatus Aenigmatarchaeota archaeon]
MKKEVVKARATISISKQVLKELDEYCSQTKPAPTDRSKVIQISIEEYLKRGKK